eukprot:6972787-Pyramimonas_sp.AAC.2
MAARADVLCGLTSKSALHYQIAPEACMELSIYNSAGYQISDKPSLDVAVHSKLHHPMQSTNQPTNQPSSHPLHGVEGRLTADMLNYARARGG